MNEMIAIETRGEITGCDGRDLHGKLGVGRIFAAWMPAKIKKYGFVEGVDYVTEVISQTGNNSGGRPLVEYFISLDMAKELAMVENNEMGRKIRRYFIECERRLLATHRNGLQAVHDRLARLEERALTNHASGIPTKVREIWEDCPRKFMRRIIRRSCIAISSIGHPLVHVGTGNTIQCACFWELDGELVERIAREEMQRAWAEASARAKKLEKQLELFEGQMQNA